MNGFRALVAGAAAVIALVCGATVASATPVPISNGVASLPICVVQVATGNSITLHNMCSYVVHVMVIYDDGTSSGCYSLSPHTSITFLPPPGRHIVQIVPC